MINKTKTKRVVKKTSFFDSVRTAIFHMFTGKDNKTLDLGRVLWAQAVLAFFGVAFVSVYNGNPIDFISFGTGIAAVLAAGGAAIGLKSSTEPEPEDKDIDGMPDNQI